jgi:hypothetical protein
MKNLNISATWLFVAIFPRISFPGVLSNYFPAKEGIFGINTTSNLIHLTTASWFIVSTRSSDNLRIQSMQIFGLTYTLISVIRFLGKNLEVGYKLSDVIYLNFLNYLQFGLGVIVSAVGSVLKKRQELITT